MGNGLFRSLLPEDKLSPIEKAIRVSKFKALAKELRSIRTSKTAGYEAKASVKHLPLYIGRRLDLLEEERRYQGLLRRVDWLHRQIFGKLNSSRAWEKTARNVYKWIDMDLRNVIRSNNKNVKALLEEIAAEAAVIDELLTDTGLKIDEDLRPYSCLPNREASIDDTSISPDLPPPEISPCEPPKVRGNKDTSAVPNSSIPQSAALRRATLVLQTLTDLDSICKKGSQRSTQLDRWVGKNPKSPLARLFRRNPDEVRRFCSKIDGHNNKDIAIDIVSQVEHIDPASVSRYWNKYRRELDY